MSSRQLRKLQKRKALEEKANVEPEVSEAEEGQTDEDVGVSVQRPKVNLFAAFGGADDSDRGSSGVGDDDHRLEEEDEQDARPEDEEAPERVEPAPSQARKKNKKNKKKKGKQAKATAKEAVDKPRSSDNGEEDEIDRALQELGLTSKKQQQQQLQKRDDASPVTHSDSRLKSGSGINELLRINTQHLKVIHEMRNLFGRDVIESANAEDEQESQRRGRQRVQNVDLETYLKEPPWAKKLPEVSLRRNVFILGRDHWPRATAGGLTMKVVGPVAGVQAVEYAYAWDRTYNDTQTLFFALVQMGDPMQMVHHLKQTPYHVSMLLQVSSVAKQDQNMALAAELCERALFTFGRMTTSAFRKDLEQGRARLDFNRPENRQFWLAGYHYIKSLIRKGTYRTALEWAKLLFAVDPGDPYAMRHLIHFLAIRAHESGWLLGFLDRLGDMSDAGDTAYLQQTRVLALLQRGDEEQARSSLARGMQTVPWLYCALFQDLNLDAPPSIWGISCADSEARTYWVRLYLHHARELWNSAQAIGLLQAVAKGLDRVSVADLPADDAPVDRGSVRLAFLDGQTGLMGLAPREILESQPNYEYDPLPPPEEENVFGLSATRAAWLWGGGRGLEGNILPGRQQHVLPDARELAGAEEGGGDEEGYEHEHEHEEDYETALAQAREMAEAIGGMADVEAGGLMAGLMRMLGMGGRGGNHHYHHQQQEQEQQGQSAAQEHEQRRDHLPGAWPEMEAGVYDYNEEDEAYDMASESSEE